MKRPPLPCQMHDPEIWFPIGSTGPALAQTELAKSYCHSCPIEDACLRHALLTLEMEGVWGGMSELERRRILRHNPPVRTEHELERDCTELVDALASP